MTKDWDAIQIPAESWSAILKITKPSVWLLHGYYPSGRNEPNKPVDTKSKTI